MSQVNMFWKIISWCLSPPVFLIMKKQRNVPASQQRAVSTLNLRSHNWLIDISVVGF